MLKKLFADLIVCSHSNYMYLQAKAYIFEVMTNISVMTYIFASIDVIYTCNGVYIFNDLYCPIWRLITLRPGLCESNFQGVWKQRAGTRWANNQTIISWTTFANGCHPSHLPAIRKLSYGFKNSLRLIARTGEKARYIKLSDKILDTSSCFCFVSCF